MDTAVTDSIEEAAHRIRAGELVAFPTETVYGLGADVFNEPAVQAIFEAKGRPQDNPLIVHLAHLDQIAEVSAAVPPVAKPLIDHFFPGPLTLILPRRKEIPSVVTAGLSTVAIRMPSHPVARAFLTACKTPVAAPSANRSGRPSPTTWTAVREDLDGRIACILRGDRSKVGLESTVVDCTGARPVVLRTGAVSLEALRAVLPDAAYAADSSSEASRSPGQQYSHYAPHARVVLVHDVADVAPDSRGAYIGLDVQEEDFDHFLLVCRCTDIEEYAFALFDFFRRCDAERVQTIYCQRVPERGLGVALMDRLRRASGCR